MKGIVRGIYILLGTALVVYFVAGIVIRLPSFRTLIRTSIEHRLETILDEEVSIAKINGDLFNGIRLNNIKISDTAGQSDLLEVDQLNINFSFSFNVLDPISFIHSIDIDGIDVNIIRSKEKKINFVTYLKRLNSKSSRSTSALTINLKSIKGKYIDHRGWGIRPSFFSGTFQDGVATVQIQPDGNIKIDLSILPVGSTERSYLNGILNQKKFLYEFELNSLKTNFWADYFVPFPAVKIKDDLLHVKGRLENKKEGMISKLPFFFHIEVDFDYLNVTIPKFSNPLKNTNGKVIFSNLYDTELVFENTFSNYNNIPIEINLVSLFFRRSIF